MTNFRFIALFALLGLLLTGCSSMKTLESHRLDSPIEIDGDYRDWEGELWVFEEEHFYLGVQNDAEFLYLCLVPNRREVGMQVINRGLTIWFDSDSGKDETFGIRFPLGGSDRMGPPPGQVEGQRIDSDAIQSDFLASLDRLEIRSGKDQGIIMNVTDLTGIQPQMAIDDGTLVYELRVPLQPTEAQPYAINVAPGEQFSLKLETGEIDMDALRERQREMGGGPPPSVGSMPGGGIGGGGMNIGGQSRRSSFNPEMLKGLDLWLKIHLSTDTIRAD